MGKRLFDIVMSLTLLALLAPVIAVVTVLVRVRLGSPVLFRQVRPGLDARPFELLKFRTMLQQNPGQPGRSSDEARLTRLGKHLRALSLDELPSLWNVLRGDMSLVGPRPLLCEYISLYSRHQARRHEVRPGVTGWAQVNGRNSLEWDAKFDLDVWYVDNRSAWLDLRILFSTVLKVLRRADISAPGQATMEPFRGSSPSRRDLQAPGD